MMLLFVGIWIPRSGIIREGLLAYRKQDTWAMVQLLCRLRELAPGG
jgi:hypothetical protein